MVQTGAEIPDKLYFRIGDVATIVGVKQHVLRFWETQFGGLSPKKSGTGQRLYRRKDVELLLEIKDLLHRQRFTIEGAKKHLLLKASAPKPARSGKGRKSTVAAAAPVRPARQTSLFGGPPEEVVEAMRTDLLEILGILDRSLG